MVRLLYLLLGAAVLGFALTLSSPARADITTLVDNCSLQIGADCMAACSGGVDCSVQLADSCSSSCTATPVTTCSKACETTCSTRSASRHARDSAPSLAKRRPR
jgi:hypothetical protein